MNTKEELRQKFEYILGPCEYIEPLMAAVDEILGKPIQIFVAPTEEQLEKLREAISKDTAILIYGEPR